MSLAQQYGKPYVIDLALNKPKQSSHDEAERIRIQEYLKIVLEVDSLKGVSLSEIADVLNKESPVTRMKFRKKVKSSHGKEHVTCNTSTLCNCDPSTMKNSKVGFVHSHYSVPEGDIAVLLVQKNVQEDVSFWIKTIDDTAFANKDFEPKRELMTMKAGEQQREVTIKVFDDDVPEPNTDFCVALFDELGDQRLIGTDTMTRVTILDNDRPGFIGFAENEIKVSPTLASADVVVKRFDGASG